MPPLRGTWKFCLRQICASRRFLGIVCISQGLACEVRSLLGKDISILVAHDGADAQHTPSEQSPSEKERTEHLNVGYVGSLYEGRGIDFIFQLAATLPAMSFFLVGGSPEEVARWQKEAPENVHFRGFVPQYDLPDTYSNFDIMLAPYAGHVAVAADHKGGSSHSTAGYMSPLKIFEYMSYGKPFIASAMPAIEEITGPGATCCLLRPYGDVNAWRDALTQLSEDPALRQRLAEASRSKFLHEYTWTKRAEKISQLWAKRLE
ncbi:MAG: glycosyltransferase family 4 protein [Desulfovibrio sp.]|nr:glycosyltransferase family 4 protein [Desulfovibrio sp.]